MRWFGRKSGRDVARPPLAHAYARSFGLGDWPSNYDAQVRDAYLRNPVAQRAVRLIAESVGQAPLACSESAVARLVATESAGQKLVETVAAQLLLHGNAFIELLSDAEDKIVELFALRPERVTIEADARGWPAVYQYRVGATTRRIEAGGPRPRIVHVKGYHPLDDHLGLGCLGVAAGAVATHNAATRWNKALLDNGARPSGALVHEPADDVPLSAEQHRRLRRELEELFQGAANAGRPLLLEGGLRWQSMSLSPSDMDFVGLKAAAARDIALAFGVPPMLLGLPGDATYANYREANRALWRLTILPLGAKIHGALARALAPWWPGLTLGIAADQVPELAEDRERLWAMVGGADFLSADEKRAAVGLTPAA